jgi:hypothetical protein
MKPSRLHALENADICVLNQMEGSSTRDILQSKLELINPSIALFAFNLLEQPGANNNEFDRFLKFVGEKLN